MRRPKRVMSGVMALLLTVQATGCSSWQTVAQPWPVAFDSTRAKPKIRVVLVNLGAEPYAGEPGDRIAQLLLVPFVAPETRVVDELPASADGRGAGGFGSSGR